MISQFVSPYEHKLLGDLEFDFPQGTHAIGRLDEESEGLLILSTDKRLTGFLMHPEKKHKRTYNVLVKNIVAQETIKKLQKGVDILIKKKGDYTTLPCEVKRIDKPEINFMADSHFTEYVPHCWLQFVLTEGKNRQIRKMCKAVNHTCKRLIRSSIEDLNLGNMKPGEVKEMQMEELFRLLKLDLKE